MKKTKTALLAAGLSAAMLLTGCSGSSSSSGKTPEGTLTGYLIENADQYVTLGNYKGLAAEEVSYTVTEDDMDFELGQRLYTYATLEEVDRPSEYGDTLSINFTAAPKGEASVSQDNYEIMIGNMDFGEDFDALITGRNKGDTFEGKVTFDELAMNEAWIGQTVDFKVTVNSVSTTIIPELDDDFVKANTEYSTVDEYKAAVRAELLESYSQEGKSNALNYLMSEAISASEFKGYPDALYDGFADQVHTQYEQWADAQGMTVEDLYKEYELTDDSIKTEIMDQVNRRLFISALCQKENLGLTDETYKEFITEQARLIGADDPAEVEQSYGKNAMVWLAYENIVSEFLYKNATITKTVNDYSASDFGTDFLTDFEGETSLEIDGLAE